ncbi:MAG: class I SAM-dependent rRNA methyltransferase [Alphaproteobacteria bacterium]|nr:class I SAM-dependent rRNA methyltransferase [Alphaproteobacteria bacterium]
MTAWPVIALHRGADRRLRAGHPWVYSNEVAMTAAVKAIPPGTLVRIATAGGDERAVAHFNPHTLIAARVLDTSARAEIDAAWFRTRLERAAAIRDRLVGGAFYRWIHAEADGLPGLIVDRFGDVVVVQPNTAGMDRAVPDVVEALSLARVVVVRGESGARRLEGLEERSACLKGALAGPIQVDENGLTFFADPLEGQKTGWFFDQRDNRAAAAAVVRRVPNARVLDLYTHTGGFAINCAAAGAERVIAVDGSAPSLALATKAASANKVAARMSVERAEVFEYLEAPSTETFDLVIADPPAFAKSRKDIKAGLQGYRKLARLAARRVARGGLLMIASCSHHAPLVEFAGAIAHGLRDAGRTARLLRTGFAGADHPVHPALPETAYLKMLTYLLD